MSDKDCEQVLCEESYCNIADTGAGEWGAGRRPDKLINWYSE